MSIKSFGSLPRLRLYTKFSHYIEILKGVFPGKYEAPSLVDELEKKLSSFLNVDEVIAVPLARVGIYLLVKNTIKHGQTVIMSPYTIADVVNMVILAGGRPVFADIDRETCNISVKSVSNLIDDETGLVLVTHFYGRVVDMQDIIKICEEKKIPVIEDAAQAFSGKTSGKFAGTLGLAGVYSFGMYKNVNSFFGGAIATNDKNLSEKIRKDLAGWPIQSKVNYYKKVISAAVIDVVTHPIVFRFFTFWIFRWAFLNNVEAINNKLKIDVNPKRPDDLPILYKSRLSGLQAKLILSQIDSVEAITNVRIKKAKLWFDGLKDIPDLILPHMKEDSSHIYWYFPIQYVKRKELVTYVMRAGRDITESYHRNCASLSCFEDFYRECPNAQLTSDQLIYLPTYPDYKDSEIMKTISVIRDYFNKKEVVGG